MELNQLLLLWKYFGEIWQDKVHKAKGLLQGVDDMQSTHALCQDNLRYL